MLNISAQVVFQWGPQYMLILYREAVYVHILKLYTNLMMNFDLLHEHIEQKYLHFTHSLIYYHGEGPSENGFFLIGRTQSPL